MLKQYSVGLASVEVVFQIQLLLENMMRQGNSLLLKTFWTVAWCSPPSCSWCFPLMFYEATMTLYSKFSFWRKDQRELEYWALGQCCWMSLIKVSPPFSGLPKCVLFSLSDCVGEGVHLPA